MTDKYNIHIKWNQFPRAVLEVLYPRRCPVCGEIVMPKGRFICPSCLLRLSPVESPTCQKCGKEVWSEEIEYCADCVKHRRSFERGMALFNYTETASCSMAAIKYENKREYLDFYAEAAAGKLKLYENREVWQFEAMVPVPVHPARKRRRGFNQAEELARRMGEYMDVPVRSDFLYRIRNTEPLKELSPDERLRNLQQAFQADERAIRASGVRRVLLVDDIYTTGSTAEACTRALLGAGIEKVSFFAVCIGQGR